MGIIKTVETLRLVLLLVLPLTGAGCITMKYTHGVPNLAQVDEGVWRGGQPTDVGWKYLKSLGVTNVVKLNLGKDDEAEAVGLKVTSVPISFRQMSWDCPMSRSIRLWFPSPRELLCIAVTARTGPDW